MTVQIYMGDYFIVKNSGIGKAIEHQKEMLRQSGIAVEEKNTDDVDIVHINTVLLKSSFAAIKAKLQKKTVVYYGHSTEEDFRNSFKGSNLLSPLFKQWIKFCYSLGDVIITPTEYSKGILKGYGLRKPIYSLSNGINTEFFQKNEDAKRRFRRKYNIGSHDKVVISVGHLIERKGILEFILLAKENPNITFIWFGITPEAIITSNVKRAIHNAPANLIFAGYVSKEEIRDAYCGADMFAFLSHEETEGIVVLEALACEIPVLVRDIPVYSGWLEHKINCYKGNSLSDFQSLTVGVISNQLPKLTQNGLEIAKQRSMCEMGKKLISVYREIENANYNEKNLGGTQ